MKASDYPVKMVQRLEGSSPAEVDLEESVRLIVELWGEGKALDEEEIMRVAMDLYGAGPEEVREAILANLGKGSMNGMFYVPRNQRSRF